MVVRMSPIADATASGEGGRPSSAASATARARSRSARRCSCCDRMLCRAVPASTRLAGADQPRSINHDAPPLWTMSTGRAALRATSSATNPSIARPRPLRPCEPSAMASTSSRFAACRIASAAKRPSSTDTCVAMPCSVASPGSRPAGAPQSTRAHPRTALDAPEHPRYHRPPRARAHSRAPRGRLRRAGRRRGGPRHATPRTNRTRPAPSVRAAGGGSRVAAYFQ